MNPLRLALLLLLPLSFAGQAFSDEDPEDVFYSELFRIEADYRANFAKVLKTADRVIIYIVKFDGVVEELIDPFGERTESIAVAPYEKRTGIIKEKVLNAEDRSKLLEVLTKQIAKKRHDGGALCHFPIHGIRIYRGGNLLHEGTFCWLCKNFSFSYPRGSEWLDTTDELEKIFTELLPIPQKELDRFNAKYPIEKPEGEQSGADQPGAAPDPTAEGNETLKEESEGRSQ